MFMSVVSMSVVSMSVVSMSVVSMSEAVYMQTCVQRETESELNVRTSRFVLREELKLCSGVHADLC